MQKPIFDPLSDETIGYHLFYIPEGVFRFRLQSIIKTLAENCGGPVFDAHVTLLARIPDQNVNIVMEKTAHLAKKLSPFKIALSKVGMENAFFRALYMRLETNQTLYDYHNLALAEFGLIDVNIYLPHFSLLYGNIDQTTKEAALKEINLPSESESTIEISSIYLYETKGKTENWKMLGKYEFGNK